MSVVYIHVRAVAFFDLAQQKKINKARKSLFKTKENSYQAFNNSQYEMQKPKTMMLRVVNDANGIDRKLEFQVENVVKISKSFHMRVKNPNTMSFTVELHEKKGSKFVKVANLKIFTRDLPVDKKSCNDLLLNSSKSNEIYTIRMITHLTDKQKCFKCDWVKSPFNEIDIPFLIDHFVKNRDQIPNMIEKEPSYNSPLLVSY